MSNDILFSLEHAKQEEQAAFEPTGGKPRPREKSPEYPKTVCYKPLFSV
jgi:hypothetical protein